MIAILSTWAPLNRGADNHTSAKVNPGALLLRGTDKHMNRLPILSKGVTEELTITQAPRSTQVLYCLEVEQKHINSLLIPSKTGHRGADSHTSAKVNPGALLLISRAKAYKQPTNLISNRPAIFNQCAHADRLLKVQHGTLCT